MYPWSEEKEAKNKHLKLVIYQSTRDVWVYWDRRQISTKYVQQKKTQKSAVGCKVLLWKGEDLPWTSRSATAALINQLHLSLLTTLGFLQLFPTLHKKQPIL